MHEVLVNRLGGLSLSRKSVVRLTDRPDMTLDVYRGRKTTMQQQPVAWLFFFFYFIYIFFAVENFVICILALMSNMFLKQEKVH